LSIHTAPLAHYLIVHPAREVHAVQGHWETRTGRSSWSGSVWVDPADGTNEDPFVWSLPWLYSYCKATGLRRVPRSIPNDPFLQCGSVIFFADKDKAKGGYLEVDTVFRVDRSHVWGRVHLPKSLPQLYLVRSHAAYMRHLQFGLPGGSSHVGKYTYTASPLVGFGGNGTFLPMTDGRVRVTIPCAALGQALEGKLKQKLAHRLPPILLTNQEMRNVLTNVWNRTAYAVCEITGPQPNMATNRRTAGRKSCPPACGGRPRKCC
jgi:hypothetical protein